MFNFEKLDIYKKSLHFSYEVYDETISWPQKYQYNIGDQLRRASLSIPLNIAEGSSKSKIDFKRYISIARGSCYECVPILEVAYKQKLIAAKQKEIWYNNLVVLAKMLSRLKSSI